VYQSPKSTQVQFFSSAHPLQNSNPNEIEMSGHYPLASYSPNFSGYAPADFLDAAETQPPEIALDPSSTGSTTPYTNIVTNASNRQLFEIREKSVTGISHGMAWRKRVKEFLANKNATLLEFLRKPLSSHPTLHQSDVFFKRFGAQNFLSNHHSLRDILLDASGVSLVSKVEEELLKVGPATSVKLVEEVRWLYDAYRQAGEETMKQEGILRTKLDSFDRVYQKTLAMSSLPMNEKSTAFQEAALEYLDTFFKEQNLEEDYKRYIESYRRFAALKEILPTFRFTETVDKEPLCSICLEESVSYCITPCGHTFCSSCVKRQATACYMCRTGIKDRVRIFFG
jgi:hypothetical protein